MEYEEALAIDRQREQVLQAQQRQTEAEAATAPSGNPPPYQQQVEAATASSSRRPATDAWGRPIMHSQTTSGSKLVVLPDAIEGRTAPPAQAAIVPKGEKTMP